MILKFTVPEGQRRKVINVLRTDLNISSGMVRRLKQANAIFANGEPVFTDKFLSGGDMLAVDITAAEPPCDVVPENGEVHILYEDDGILALNKPSGQIVHPTHSRYSGTLANFAAGYLEKTRGSGALHAVNRLDRDTGGAVMFALNSYMMTVLADAVSREEAKKEYIAFVCGHISGDKGVIDAPIKRVNETDLRRCVDKDGQRSVTHFEVLNRSVFDGEKVSAVKFVLETGRTHQIRVHCEYMGHPILGDPIYCSEKSRLFSEKNGIKGQMLHAANLEFIHPISGEKLAIKAPLLREDMKKLSQRLNIGY